MYRYRKKLTSNLRVSSIMDALPDELGYLHAKRVGDTLNNFIASADEAFKLVHVPEVNLENLSSEDSSVKDKAEPGYLNSTKWKKVG